MKPGRAEPGRIDFEPEPRLLDREDVGVEGLNVATELRCLFSKVIGVEAQANPGIAPSPDQVGPFLP